jgi:hypothetical protein
MVWYRANNTHTHPHTHRTQTPMSTGPASTGVPSRTPAPPAALDPSLHSPPQSLSQPPPPPPVPRRQPDSEVRQMEVTASRLWATPEVCTCTLFHTPFGENSSPRARTR